MGDSTGTLQTQYTYEPFGYTTQTGQANTNSYKYTGREDDGSGLDYYRARYYHPRLQRFIAEDPKELAGGDANLYAYVSNDPITFIDPYGLASKSYQVGPYDVRIDTGHGAQRHAHIQGPGIASEVQINRDGTPSHKCKDPLPRNKRLLQFLRSKGFALSIAFGIISVIDAAGTSADAAVQALGDALGDALAAPILGASPAE